MKQRILLAALLMSAASWGQSSLRGNLVPGNSNKLKTRSSLPSAEKTLLCVDTLRYPQAKEQILGTSNFYSGFGVWQADNESVSQAFLNSSSLTITGIEFFGARSTSGAASVTVNAAIYNVDASNVPTTIIGSGNVTITATAYGNRYVTFATPVIVTGNYAVVLKPTNTNGILNLYVNDVAIGQPYDEFFTRFYSSYASYPNPNVWNTIPTFEANAANYEVLVAPIVNYTINAGFTAAPTTVCQGTPVVYTNTTTPAGHLANRMTNYQTFRTYFGTAPSDSTYVYDMDNSSPFIWSGSTTYTHPAAGTYDVFLGVNGGFWSSCFDFVTHPVTVNPVPAAPTITAGGPTTFCAGGSVTLTSSASTGNTWSNGLTTSSITASAAGNYTVTATSGGCTSAASSVVAVTVNPSQNASFSYPSYTLCTGGANPSATAVTSGGTYSSTAGLVFANASTGEIDMAASAQGTYTVTYTTGGACPGTSTHSVTLTAAPDASFSYASASYCANGTDPAPVFASGASAGAFTSTTGLVIDAAGNVDLSASTAGTYTVTNSIAASGACPATSETSAITISAVQSPAFAAVAPACAGSPIAALPVTSTNGIDGTWSPAINNTATTIYTFTPASGECASTATLTITVNQPVEPAFNAGGSFCEGSAVPALPATSTNGISGTWSPAINNTATTTYTFTPAASACATTATTVITINDQIAPEFTAIETLCKNAAAPGLQAMSNNGVSGTWSPATISTAATGTTVYTFTPAQGACAEQATLSVTVDGCLSVDENVFGSLSVFPNPAADDVTVSFTSGSLYDVELALITNDGKLVSVRTVKANTAFNEKIDLSGVAKGVYFIRLNTENGTAIQKIVKQ